MKRNMYHKNKLVGTLDEEALIFRKQVSGKKHLMKVIDSWGIDRKVLYQLPPKTIIRIRDKDDGTVYITSLARFRRGIQLYTFQNYEWDFAKMEEEHGQQIFFPRSMFNRLLASGEKIVSEEAEAWWKSLVWFETIPEHETHQQLS